MKISFFKAAFLVLASHSASAENLRGSSETSAIPREAVFLGESGDSCPKDKEKSVKKFGKTYKFKEKGDKGERCTDDDDKEYSYGTYKDVKNSSNCAKKCVEDIDEDLLDSLEGFDYNCKKKKCMCLFDEGELNNKREKDSDFDGFDEDGKGDGHVKETESKGDVVCMKLKEVKSLLADDAEEIGTLKQYR